MTDRRIVSVSVRESDCDRQEDCVSECEEKGMCQ